MSLGSRIEQRRRVVGISQAELARRVGISQSTMNSLINGDSRSSRSLHKIALHLKTTPAFLSGETDDPDEGAIAAPLFSSRAMELAALFDRFDASGQSALITVARSLGVSGAVLAEPASDWGAPPASAGNSVPVELTLPSEDALARMFEGLLMTIDPNASVAEQARLLATRLPIGLSQLRDLSPAPAAASRTPADRAAAPAAFATPDREPR